MTHSTDIAATPLSLWNTETPDLHLGMQRFLTADEHVEFLARHGVRNMALNAMPLGRDIGCMLQAVDAVRHGA
ncbi:MAG: hypothetical protein O2782_20715 [bacterium]|nr:hypothetical protein [bacterium]